jgi:hypothetical protein
MANTERSAETMQAFAFAMHALKRAIDRLEDEEQATETMYTIIESAWWICAAAQTLELHQSGDILQGFWWVRNKGNHNTFIAFNATEWLGNFNIWQSIPDHLRGGGAAEAYIAFLEGRDIRETIFEAHDQMVPYKKPRPPTSLATAAVQADNQ